MNKKWETRTLGSLCDFVRGPFGGSLKKSCFKTSGYAVYEQQHAIYDQFEDIRYFIDESKYLEMSRFKLSSGDLIMSCSGTMGKVAIVPNDIPKGIINQALLKLSPRQNIISEFLKYWMNSPNFQNQLVKLSQGVAIKNVASVKILKEIEINLPAILEQKRIVAILDEAFEGIDRAIANTEKNLTNARELFESYLNEIFTQKGNGWEWVSLSDITTDITDGDHQPPPKSQSGIPFITISNINKQDRKVDFSNTFKVSPEYFEKLKDNRKPRKGDLLYTVTGSYGIPVVVDHDMNFCFQRHIGLIRPHNETNSKCLYYMLLSRHLLSQADECATGTAQKTVSLSGLRRFSVPKIPKEKQEIIVTELDVLSEQICHLESIYHKKLAALNELKQSILQKAFTGELTANTYNLITKAAERSISA